MRTSDRPYVLALDCGTTGNRAIVFDRHQRVLAQSYREFTQYYPRPGWVEHDPEEIWRSVCRVLKDVMTKVSVRKIRAMGITNQRETLVVWNRRTGRPLHRAIVWQCRRSSAICEDMKREGWEKDIHRKTGLFLDPYFSATKILWLSRRYPAILRGMRKGEVVCGTIDSWVLWKLSGGSFSTDPTNASRTMLYNIRRGGWDKELLKLFHVPALALAELVPSSAERGRTVKRFLGDAIPITGVAGDQQASAFAQGLSEGAIVKNTYGTGLFIVAETGSRPRFSEKLVTTVAATDRSRLQYALEGSIFIGGAAIQWLRDGLGVIKNAAESERIARRLGSNEGVYFVPALQGLGCPHWDPHARGMIIGLTRQTRGDHLIRAGLEAIAYETRDCVDLLQKEMGRRIKRIRVDGGAVRNNFLMQFQADIIGCEVERPRLTETTALGAAGLAGIAAGLWKDQRDFLKARRIDRVFRPRMKRSVREAYYSEWRRALQRSMRWT